MTFLPLLHINIDCTLTLVPQHQEQIRGLDTGCRSEIEYSQIDEAAGYRHLYLISLQWDRVNFAGDRGAFDGGG